MGQIGNTLREARLRLGFRWPTPRRRRRSARGTSKPSSRSGSRCSRLRPTPAASSAPTPSCSSSIPSPCCTSSSLRSRSSSRRLRRPRLLAAASRWPDARSRSPAPSSPCSAGLALVGLDVDRGPPPLPAPLPTVTPTVAPRAAPTAAPHPRAQAPPLVLAAIRGDCWLSVRRDSAAGAVVWQGLLQRGASLRFARLPLWIRMGAPWNLEARLGSRALDGLPSAPRPANVLVSSAGVIPA